MTALPSFALKTVSSKAQLTVEAGSLTNTSSTNAESWVSISTLYMHSLSLFPSLTYRNRFLAINLDLYSKANFHLSGPNAPPLKSITEYSRDTYKKWTNGLKSGEEILVSEEDHYGFCKSEQLTHPNLLYRFHRFFLHQLDIEGRWQNKNQHSSCRCPWKRTQTVSWGFSELPGIPFLNFKIPDMGRNFDTF